MGGGLTELLNKDPAEELARMDSELQAAIRETYVDEEGKEEITAPEGIDTVRMLRVEDSAESERYGKFDYWPTQRSLSHLTEAGSDDHH
eukprot:NODE_5481_length_382_cov_416.735736_g4358_i1.p1 GENE.NODE_5481_length_382_cov_416.735736_g4358_i1~~NODE_5481_length_382_cov_416.735736_g4358_i1.p1  ORF type:complete len:96 (+),score=30.74 NODE_5481_length_382_cov_416.735736_g4358_i1:24-290(+)